jgi:hypothetical protein
MPHHLECPHAGPAAEARAAKEEAKTAKQQEAKRKAMAMMATRKAKIEQAHANHRAQAQPNAANDIAKREQRGAAAITERPPSARLRVVVETGDDRELIPSANFAGVKNGYFYPWGERGAATDATLESVTEGG